MIDVFYALLRSGLWEQDVILRSYEPIDFDALYKLADEQSVVGLIGAGLEHISDMKVEKMQARPFLKKVFAIEQRNREMNASIGRLESRLHNAGVPFVLIKGQGIAQCYERPLWRAAGDIDLLLDAENYEKAKSVLCPLASQVDIEGLAKKHQGMTIDGFEVELHGALSFGLSRRAILVLTQIHSLVCFQGQTRIWHNEEGSIDILLPSADNDVLIIFTHFLLHFYKGGIGLRQISDWCRLLWTYRESIDRDLLHSRLAEAELTSEWKAFATYAVDYLGMPIEAMPFYEDRPSWHRKARRLQSFIMKVGNFGHNRDMSYYRKYPYVVRKAISAGQRLGDGLAHLRIFPGSGLTFLCNSLLHGFRAAMRGE